MTLPVPLLALHAASRRFPSAQALDNADIEIRAGQVHALLGENGAGKTTLAKILAGLDSPDEGTVKLDGDAVAFTSRADAIRHGIGLVPQNDSLLDDLTLVENLALAQPQWVVRRRQAATQLRAAAEQGGIAVDLDTRTRDLSRGQRQLGELALALAQGARVLLLDEPTSALGPQETGRLFDRIRALAASGVAIMLITHRLADVRAVADVATVLAHGRVAYSGPVGDVDDATLVRTMVGTLPPAPTRTRRVHNGPAVLTLDRVSATCGDQVPARDISVTVRAGEIVGVFGFVGNGQKALAEVAGGQVPPSSGTRTVAGATAYVPERRLDGLLPTKSAALSAVAARLGESRFVRRGLIDHRQILRAASELFERHDVRPRDPSVPVVALSGGNQQKLLVGRELDANPELVVLHGPTQGLDLRASRAIHQQIVDAAERGTAVVLVSADRDEIRELADRIVVLSRGRIVGEFPPERFDDALTLRLTTGPVGPAGDHDDGSR